MTNEFEFIIREHTAGGTCNITNPYYSKLRTLELAEHTARKFGRIDSWIEILEVNDDFSYCKTAKTFCI